MIRFACPPHLHGLIPEPIPARQVVPDWLKRLKLDDTSERDSNHRPARTIRACMPFMDAIGTGWIIRAPSSVHIWEDAETHETRYSWQGEWTALSHHGPAQVGGASKRLPLKWHNPWLMRVPKGWSVLIVPPLNRPNPGFECLSGVVDCDRYPNQVNFPFFLTGPGGDLHVEQGAPLVQVIPFKRAEAACPAEIGTMTEAEVKASADATRMIGLKPSWYRLDLHVRKILGG